MTALPYKTDKERIRRAAIEAFQFIFGHTPKIFPVSYNGTEVKKKPELNEFCVQFRLKVVEVTGLEPTTFWSLTRRATKLRYTSVLFKQ